MQTGSALQHENVGDVSAFPLTRVLLRGVDDDFADLDLPGRIERLLRAPGKIPLGLDIELAFVGLVIFLRDRLGVRLPRFVRDIHGIPRVDHDDVFEAVRDDELLLEHIDDLDVLAVIGDGVLVVLCRLADVFIKRRDIDDARPFKGRRHEIAPVGVQDLGEAHGRNGLVRDELPAADIQLFAVLHDAVRENGQQHPRLDAHDAAVPKAVLAPFRTAGDRLPAHVDEVIALARIRRLAHDDRHAVCGADLLDLCHARRIIAVQKALRGDDEQLLVGIAVPRIGDDGRRRLQGDVLRDDRTVEPLERLQLSLDDVLIPLVGEDDELVAKRDVAEDGLLEHRAPLTDLQKLFGVVLARQRPEPVAAATRKYQTFHITNASAKADPLSCGAPSRPPRRRSPPSLRNKI